MKPRRTVAEVLLEEAMGTAGGAHRELKRAINELVVGRIGWRKFELVARPHVARMGRAVYRMWRLPIGVAEEDVVQEVYVGMFQAIRSYNRSFSPDASAWVVGSAFRHAKKWVQRQRGRAGQHKGDSWLPSRIAAPFSSRVDGSYEGTPEEAHEHLMVSEATQEADVEYRSLVAAMVGSAPTRRDADALRVLLLDAGGDEEAAARMIYERPSEELEMDAYSERRCLLLVREARARAAARDAVA